jgi:hypothetical protein
MKEKAKYKVELPMKKLNWGQLPAHVLSENSFWVKAKDEEFASPDLFKLLQENFSTKPAKSKSPQNFKK